MSSKKKDPPEPMEEKSCRRRSTKKEAPRPRGRREGAPERRA